MYLLSGAADARQRSRVALSRPGSALQGNASGGMIGGLLPWSAASGRGAIPACTSMARFVHPCAVAHPPRRCRGAARGPVPVGMESFQGAVGLCGCRSSAQLFPPTRGKMHDLSCSPEWPRERVSVSVEIEGGWGRTKELRGFDGQDWTGLQPVSAAGADAGETMLGRGDEVGALARANQHAEASKQPEGRQVIEVIQSFCGLRTCTIYLHTCTENRRKQVYGAEDGTAEAYQHSTSRPPGQGRPLGNWTGSLFQVDSLTQVQQTSSITAWL